MFPLSLGLVREMDFISFVEGWSFWRAEQSYSHEKFTANWAKKREWVQTQITPNLVKSLSRWAQKEMQTYQQVPPLTKVKFKPVRMNPEQNKIVLEGTVDTLPSHSPVVTRWLKIFLLYDVLSDEVIQATITIRGEVLE